MATTSSTTDESTPIWRKRLGCLGAIVALVMLIVSVPLSLYLVEMSRGRRALQAEVQRLRARKAPLTTIELNERYQKNSQYFPAGRELYDALAQLKQPALQTAAKRLPFVGDKPEPPPLAEHWVEQAEAEQYVAQAEATLALIERFAQEGKIVRYPHDLTPGYFALLPHVQELREGARALSLKFHVNLRAGDVAAAIARIEETVYLAETLVDEPFLISQLVRIAVIGVALHEVEYLLANKALTDEQLARLQTVFRSLDMPKGFQVAIDGERATNYTASTWPMNMALGNATTSPLSKEEIARLAKKEPRNPGDVALTLNLFRRLQEASDESLAAAAAEADLIDGELKQLQGSHRRLLHMHTLLLFPAVQSTVKAFQRASARCQSADACLAALRYRQAHGEWPMSLQQLVPQYLPAEPVDPYTGKTMIYKTFPGECKVYALGENQLDDDGVWTDSQWTDVGFVAPWRE